MGIGDFKGAAEMMPALTTIRIPARLIGRMTADKINAMLDADTQNFVQNLKVPFEVKQRRSLAAPPSEGR